MSQSLIAHYESKRNMAFKRLRDAVTCARNCASDPNQTTRLETWCLRLDQVLESFNEALVNLTCELHKGGMDEKEVQVAQCKYLEQADDMYAEVLEAKRKYLSVKVEPPSSVQPRETATKTKLPPMKLPTFTGQLKDFPGFIDLFNTLVHHRSDITNVEKFQYLITTLSGEPINIIRAFPVSEANYISAYNALLNRYNNKRYLAFMCWEQINNLKSMCSGSAQNLRNMLDVYSENLSMLSSLGLPTTNWDFVLFHSLLTKLDKASREAFELQSITSDFPSFKELQTFLVDRCNALERSSLNVSNNSSSSSASQPQNNKRVNSNIQTRPTMLLAQASNQSCVVCKENHALYSCSKFLSKSPYERSQVVRQNKLCFNCLRANHITANCKSTHTCKACNQRHNSLIHYSKGAETGSPVDLQHKQSSAPLSRHSVPTDDIKENVITPVTSLSNIASGPISNAHFVLLATAEVEVKDGRGSYQKVRVLLDPGSQSQIITKACARRLGLTQYKTQTPMSGIGQVPACSSSKVFLEIRPVGKLEPSFTTEAVTLDRICGDMPTHPVNIHNFEHVSNVKLADEKYHSSRPVDILIGGEIFPQILLPGKIDGGPHAATAINTIFGFILMGKTVSSASSSSTPLSINHVSMDANLDVAIQKFWELDNIPCGDTKQSHSMEDIQCEDIFQSTHQRDTNGRYIVQLPFREQSSPPEFESAYSIALRRFVQLEKRLMTKPAFHEQYTQHVMEYLSSGQMEKVPAGECQSPTAFYLAHHAVSKSDRSLRVVYDASMKDKKGVSLNDTLLTGAKLQADITNILLRFRLHAIVFCADVRQMYRQIRIAEEHLDYQRILFRCSPSEPIQEYRLNRVTFGVSSAPFLAIRVLHQLARDEGESFPAAARVLLEDIYVDDAVTGCQSIEEAASLQQQLIAIMAAGGFELRKWSSNHAAVLKNIPDEHKAVPNINQTFDCDGQFVKILGLAWNSQNDIFNYQVNQINRECTKRTMLSELARIYDPIGLLTPLTFLAKHLIQRLWLLGSSWDQPVPEDINQIWSKYSQQLPHLSQLQIPRRITSDDAVSYQLHGFSDASEAGFAAVVYLRSTNQHNQHQVILVSARSRVCPTKRRTLPRLELCGASLLADLMRHIINMYIKLLTIESIHAWTDSMIVLSWIRSNSSGFKAFVGNRISNIQRKLPEATWKHVPGKHNPADPASRGLTPDELINHDQWWTGPQWLSLDQEQWPKEPQHSNVTYQTDLEVNCENRTCVLTVSNTVDDTHPIDHLLNKVSSLRKIQRILAYCNRFIEAMRKKKKCSGHITEKELQLSLMTLVKHVQITTFGEEIKLLRSNRVLPKSFRKLSAFLDDSNILRVGGRLSQSQLSYETKHPALLPRTHRLTQLIIQCTHNEHLHPGLQTLHYLLLQNFWILSPRRAINQIISKCHRCFRVKPHNFQPVMADLPRSRITQIKAFQRVGCDFAGPFNISFQRYRGARTTKAWLCLFVCFATRALHLELCSSLSADAFLASLRRFIARRGRCNTIHSDCGTNFIGAQSQLVDLMRSACESERIEFVFNVPGSPHMGGLWEAGVKSVKTHLYRVVGTQILTYEELNTLLAQVESVLNSRPISAMSSDPSDVSALTPGHFLTLAPLTTVPTPDYSESQMNRLNRWQLIQKMHQDFWSRWHIEYITGLSQRLKWTIGSPPAKINQLVIIKDETTHPLRWRLGRIVELYSGRDGIPRSASVKTAQGVLKRPLVKLCPLPDVND